MSYSIVNTSDLQLLVDFVGDYLKSPDEKTKAMIEDLAKTITRQEAPMQLGPSATFFGKLNQHKNTCHAAELHLKDKLNENDFSWLPLLSHESEELWRMFQEEYRIKGER